jgi:RHS repeat-associated protein
MVACAETLTAEDKVKGPFAHTDLRAGDSNIPNGTTDICWFGWQTMEERNSSNTATCQYVWGNYLDECIQINLLQPAGPQQLGIGVYYPLQDTLYRTMALANSSGAVVEAYDTDAYGNTIIFTGPGADNTWFTDDDTQSSYGANDIIYCGYRYDAETENYYVRNRYYSPSLGRWLTRDPIGYQGGIDLYGYVNSSPVVGSDWSGHGCLVTFDCRLAKSWVSRHNSSIRNCVYQCTEVRRQDITGPGSTVYCESRGFPRPPIVTEHDSHTSSWWGLCGTPPKCPPTKPGYQQLYYAAAGGPWGNCSRHSCRKNCGDAYEISLHACELIPNDKYKLACKVAAHVWDNACTSACNAICKKP